MKKKILAVTAVIILLIFSFIRLFYIDSIQLKAYETEGEKIAYYYLNTVYSENDSLNIRRLLEEKGFELQQIYYIQNNKIYFSYEYLNAQESHWCLGSIELDGSRFTEISDEIFDSVFNVTFDDYSKRKGYYLDGKIILTDFNKLIEYDVKNDVLKRLNYDNYQSETVKLVYTIDNFEKVVFEKNLKTFILDKDILSECSVTAKEVISSNNNIIWNGTNALEYFFDSVQIVNDEVYLICRVLDFWGTTYALTFKCDLERMTYEYVGFHKTGDVINQFEFYVIPT